MWQHHDPSVAWYRVPTEVTDYDEAHRGIRSWPAPIPYREHVYDPDPGFYITRTNTSCFFQRPPPSVVHGHLPYLAPACDKKINAACSCGASHEYRVLSHPPHWGNGDNNELREVFGQAFTVATPTLETTHTKRNAPPILQLDRALKRIRYPPITLAPLRDIDFLARGPPSFGGTTAAAPATPGPAAARGVFCTPSPPPVAMSSRASPGPIIEDEPTTVIAPDSDADQVPLRPVIGQGPKKAPSRNFAESLMPFTHEQTLQDMEDLYCRLTSKLGLIAQRTKSRGTKSAWTSQDLPCQKVITWLLFQALNAPGAKALGEFIQYSATQVEWKAFVRSRTEPSYPTVELDEPRLIARLVQLQAPIQTSMLAIANTPIASLVKCHEQLEMYECFEEIKRLLLLNTPKSPDGDKLKAYLDRTQPDRPTYSGKLQSQLCRVLGQKPSALFRMRRWGQRLKSLCTAFGPGIMILFGANAAKVWSENVPAEMIDDLLSMILSEMPHLTPFMQTLSRDVYKPIMAGESPQPRFFELATLYPSYFHELELYVDVKASTEVCSGMQHSDYPTFSESVPSAGSIICRESEAPSESPSSSESRSSSESPSSSESRNPSESPSSSGSRSSSESGASRQWSASSEWSSSDQSTDGGLDTSSEDEMAIDKEGICTLPSHCSKAATPTTMSGSTEFTLLNDVPTSMGDASYYSSHALHSYNPNSAEKSIPSKQAT